MITNYLPRSIIYINVLNSAQHYWLDPDFKLLTTIIFFKVLDEIGYKV